MNIFWHELRQRRKGAVGWLAGMAVLIAMSFAKYATLSSDASATKELLDQFPATIQAVFGISGLDLTTLTGYFASIYLYIAILGAVHAGLVGSGVLADEEQHKTAEFLYVRPISRWAIVTQKIGAGLVLVASMWLVAAGVSWAMLAGYGSTGEYSTAYWLFMAALGVMQTTFFALGAVSAALSRTPAAAARTVSIGILASYCVFALTKLLPDITWLHYVSVFDYFDAATILKNGSLAMRYVGVCGLASAVATIITYLVYRRRDMSV